MTIVAIFTRETAYQIKDFIKITYPVMTIAPQGFEIRVEIRDECEMPILSLSIRKDNYHNILPLLKKLAEGDLFKNIEEMMKAMNKKVGEWIPFGEDTQIRAVKKVSKMDASDLNLVKE